MPHFAAFDVKFHDLVSNFSVGRELLSTPSPVSHICSDMYIHAAKEPQGQLLVPLMTSNGQLNSL